MLEIVYKHRVIKVEHWDQLSQHEFIELWRRINASWFNAEGRVELTKWLYSNQCSDKFIIKKLKYNRLKLCGPENGFRNMTAGEFLFADTYYFTYLRDNNAEILDKFIATIFRKKAGIFTKVIYRILKRRKFADNRIEFDENLINARAKLIENIVFKIKQAILFNYGAVRKDMTKKFKYLFPIPPDPEKNKKTKTKIVIPNWEIWMWQLASGNTDADFNKVASTLALNFFRRIDMLIKESKPKK